MKRIILIFITLCINIYGNLLTTNGKLSLYFDQNDKRIHGIRGNVFEKEDIAILDLGVFINNKGYLLRNHIKSVEIVANTNVISIKSEIEENEFNTFVFPSSFEREKLYVSTIIKKKNQRDEITFLYRIYPYNDINRLDFVKLMDYYKIDDYRLKSLNNPMTMYISDEEFLENLKFKEVRKETIKYQDEKILLASKLIGNNLRNRDTLIFNFGTEKWENKIVFNPGILRMEYEAWQEWNWEFQEYSKEIQEQLTQLRMITMEDVIPGTLSYTESVEKLSTNMKLAVIMAEYGKGEKALQILSKYRFGRRNSSEDVAIFLSLIKSWEYSKSVVDESYIRTTIYPILQRVLEGIDENGVFNIEEQNIEVYYNIVDILGDILEKGGVVDYLPIKRIIKKREAILSNIQKNYMTPDGIKDTPKSLSANPKNIKYIELYPQEVRSDLLKEEYEKYYSVRSGFLEFSNEEFIDIEYNLEFVRLLYANNQEGVAERIFARLKELVKKNNNYITPKMHPFEKNEAGIYGDLIYLYLRTNYFRGIE